jgi:hypothetical protein
MFEAYNGLSLRLRGRVMLIALLVVLAVGAKLAYQLIEYLIPAYPVIQLPQNMSVQEVDIDREGFAEIIFDADEDKIEAYIALLKDLGWTPCDHEICGFVTITHAKILGTFYHKDMSSSGVIMFYTPGYFRGPRMSISGCGDIKHVTMFTQPSKWGCTLVVPVSAVVK